MFALRNVTDEARQIAVNSPMKLSEWNPASGDIVSLTEGRKCEMLPHSTRYFTVTENALGDASTRLVAELTQLTSAWSVETDTANMARLTDLQFLKGDEWIDAIHQPTYGEPAGQPAIGIPPLFHRQSRIPMRGRFECESVPESLSILFEMHHLASLQVNGVEVDPATSRQLCIGNAHRVESVEIDRLAKIGANTVSGIIEFQDFEPSIECDAFLGEWCMPSCDVFLAGSFRAIDGVVRSESAEPLSLPIDLSNEGWQGTTAYSGSKA